MNKPPTAQADRLSCGTAGVLRLRSRLCGATGAVAVGDTGTARAWSTLGWSVAWVFLLLAVFGVSVDAQPVSDRVGRLFVAGETPAARLSARPGAGVLRERIVRLDRDVLAVARTSAGRVDARPAVVRLDLFDGVAFNAVVERTGPTSAGYWLSGRVEGWALGSVTLVVNGEVIAGTVRAPGATYAIRSVGDDLHAIRQLDPAALLTFEDDTLSLEPVPFEDDSWQFAPAAQTGIGRVRPIRSAARIRRAEAPPAEDGSRVDVLVVYTPAARDAQGGRVEIDALIDLHVAEANQAYADSGVIQRLQLVGALMVDYEETKPDRGHAGGLAGNVDLYRLVQPNDGHLDEVHDLRDRYAADIVTFVGHYPDETGGIAALCDDPPSGRRGCTPQSWFAFNLINHEASSGAFVHELGHTMGLNHDRYAATRCWRCEVAPEQDLTQWEPYPYAFGYVNQRALEPDAPESSRWRTIMAYGDQCRDAGIRCTTLLRFSNPDQTHSLAPDTAGDPMGVPGDDPSPLVDGPADARRTLNEMRRIVANFRVAPCARDGMRIRLHASNGQYVVAVGNGGGEVLAAESHLGPWSELTLVDANGGCVESGDAVSLHTSDGFYLRARQGGGSTLDATDPQATPWAQFIVGRHRGAGAIRNLDSITLQAESGHYVCAEDGGGGSVRADCDSPGLWGTFKLSAGEVTSPHRNWLVGGQRLLPRQSIRAEGAACRLEFQTDGNLVAYNEGMAYWSARTGGAATGGSARMQSDGNFVVYDAAGVARWSTGTAGNPGAFLVIERDCNVVLRAAGGAELWSSGRP